MGLVIKPGHLLKCTVGEAEACRKKQVYFASIKKRDT